MEDCGLLGRCEGEVVDSWRLLILNCNKAIVVVVVVVVFSCSPTSDFSF